jgi:hypothetical protein
MHLTSTLALFLALSVSLVSNASASVAHYAYIAVAADPDAPTEGALLERRGNDCNWKVIFLRII